jgi:uncharacterized protein (DUF362 family)/ferredoxin
MSTISIQNCAAYDPTGVDTALHRLLEPWGGMPAFVKPGERVLVKPNLLYGKPPEHAVTTHPEILRGVIGMVRAAGGIPLVGDSPGFGDLRRVAEKSGLLAVIEAAGAELVEFREPVEVRGRGTFRNLALARPYVEADRVINLPKLKTHEMMTLTCAVKNLFGSVVGAGKANWHLKAGADRELFARLLLEIYLYRPPDLNIVDAVTAMEGDGPGSGDPVHVGLLLAGTDAVALDHVAASVAGIPRKLLYVERAAGKMGLLPEEEPEIVGVPLTEAVRRPFRLPPVSDVQFGLPVFLKNLLRHQLSTRPCVIPDRCRLCSICVKACPPAAIEIREGTLAFDYRKCIRCFCCRELCPEGALKVKSGFLLKLVSRLDR